MIYGVDNIPPNWIDYYSPLSFKAVNGPANVALSSTGSPNTITLDYKKNNGSWTAYSIGDTIELVQNDIVAFRGSNNKFSKGYYDFYNFVMTGTIEAKGNIQSLMNYNNNCTNACYFKLFNRCTSLLTAPSLPAITLAPSCYFWMFSGCTSLTSAPSLPATNLANSCYRYMFQGCTSLTSTPSLPATGLANYCYEHMFASCYSLTEVPTNLLSEVTALNQW